MKNRVIVLSAEWRWLRKTTRKRGRLPGGTFSYADSISGDLRAIRGCARDLPRTQDELLVAEIGGHRVRLEPPAEAREGHLEFAQLIDLGADGEFIMTDSPTQGTVASRCG